MWLTFCVTRNKAYCFYCCAAESRGLINFGEKAKGTFVTRFWQLEKSKRVLQRTRALSSTPWGMYETWISSTPICCCKTNSWMIKKHQREMLIKEMSSVRYLARQGLALRSHKEEDGNLMQLLKCRADDVEGMGTWKKVPISSYCQRAPWDDNSWASSWSPEWN